MNHKSRTYTHLYTCTNRNIYLYDFFVAWPCMYAHVWMYTDTYIHLCICTSLNTFSHARTSCTLLLYRHTHTETCHAFQETCKHHSRERVMYYSLSGISVQVWDWTMCLLASRREECFGSRCLTSAVAKLRSTAENLVRGHRAWDLYICHEYSMCYQPVGVAAVVWWYGDECAHDCVIWDSALLILLSCVASDHACMLRPLVCWNPCAQAGGTRSAKCLKWHLQGRILHVKWHLQGRILHV